MRTTNTAGKRARTRLAKAELWMVLAMAAARLDDYSSQAVRIANTYGLSEKDLKRMLDAIGAELENRAIRAGYEESWDVPPEWDPATLTWQGVDPLDPYSTRD